MNARLPVAPKKDWPDDYPPATLPLLHRLTPAFDKLPLAEAIDRRCVLFRERAAVDRYIGVISDPRDINLQRWAEGRVGDPVIWHLASADDLVAWLNKQAETTRLLAAPETGETAPATDSAPDQALSLSRISQQASPVVRLVNATLHDALRLGASDIHLESTSSGLDIRYRIDGVLEHIRTARGSDVAQQVISRLKVLAELDIAETRIPQDGRLAVRLDDSERRIDLRVSIMPSLHGEDGVLRILDKSSLMQGEQALTLASLGFSVSDMERLRDLAAQPYGMLLASGPTGSGKTTSLYARAGGNPRRPGKDHHHRGSGGVPVAGHPADPGEREKGPHLRARPALDPAPRPGHHHGRRDPRPRDGGNSHPVRADRTPGVVDAARQPCFRRLWPLQPHGHRSLSADLGDQRRLGATPAAQALSGMRAGHRRQRNSKWTTCRFPATERNPASSKRSVAKPVAAPAIGGVVQ